MKFLKKKIFVSIVLVISLMTQILTVYGQSVPSEVDGKIYREVPVVCNGEKQEQIVSKYLEWKDSNKKGYAVLDVKGYAYQTGNDVKIGMTIGYQTPDGYTTPPDWLDQIETISNTTVEKVINGNYCINFQDMMLCDNGNKLWFYLQGGKGGSFNRQSAKDIKLSPTSPIQPELFLTAQTEGDYVALDWSTQKGIPTSAIYKVYRREQQNNSAYKGITATQEMNYKDTGELDMTGPTRPKLLKVDVSSYLNSAVIQLSGSTDVGTAYSYMVEALVNNNVICNSNDATVNVTSGLEGYIVKLSNNPSLLLKAERDSNKNIIVSTKATDSAPVSIYGSNFLMDGTVDFKKAVYIYVAAVDKSGNLSEVTKSSLFGLEGKEIKVNGSVWAELSWTQPTYLQGFTLIKTNKETKQKEEIVDTSGKYEDKLTKEKPNGATQINASYSDGKVSVQFTPAEVIKKTFEYRVKAQDNERNFYTTESFEATLQAGIQGYLMSVDNNPDGTPSELKELVSKGSLLTYEGKVPDLFDSTKVGYVHIQTKDNQGNLSDVVTAQINANYAKVTLGIKPKSSTKMLDTFEVDTDGPNYKEKILNMAYPVIKDKEACDVFTIEISPSKQLEQVRYQFVESSTKPTFPTTTSPEWANIDRVNYSYPDATTGKLIEGTTTIGNLVTLPKEGLRVTQEIPLSDVPDKSGNFYFVLIVQDKDSPAREILYGPFIISDIIPNVIVDKNITEITNYIAPEGYSCIEIDTKFSPGATERSLALDLKSILGIENGEEDPLLKYDLEHPIYTIKNKAGKEGTPIGKTELKINDTKDGYMVIIENEVPDNYFDITIFIPTKLQPTTKYSKNGAAGTCLAILNGAKTDGDMNIPATATAKILVNKITKEDGTEELEYREVIKVNNRIMTYVPIPTVN